MRIGIDLDNTLVCYDELFAKLADECGLLADEVQKTKQAIRDSLRRTGKEEQWTRMQGIAYGRRMDDAACFPGAIEFLQGCRERKIDWFIISHRSQVPYLGDPVDLHDAARRWLVHRGLVLPDESQRVYLELTIDAKLQRIRDVRCDVFVDDLAEVLTHPKFPLGVRRFLFDPKAQNHECCDYERVSSWDEVTTRLLANS